MRMWHCGTYVEPYSYSIRLLINLTIIEHMRPCANFGCNNKRSSHIIVHVIIIIIMNQLENAISQRESGCAGFHSFVLLIHRCRWFRAFVIELRRYIVSVHLTCGRQAHLYFIHVKLDRSTLQAINKENKMEYIKEKLIWCMRYAGWLHH